jgi:very-short-patch-repair endonuclease
MPRTRKSGTTRARALRRAMTEAEKRLWWHLNRVPAPGTHFHRQAAIGPYVLDFVCHSAKLVIEVDGAQHGYTEQAADDLVRTRWLEGRGYRVLRFWNGEVMNDVEVVLDTIHAALYSSTSPGGRAGTPTPSPSPQGGGE